MKLWIDDMRTPPDATWTWAKSYKLAIAFINSMLVTEISFKHDLGEEKTGRDIAEYIAERVATKNDLPAMDWKIHSANPTGHEQIADAMEKCDDVWHFSYTY